MKESEIKNKEERELVEETLAKLHSTNKKKLWIVKRTVDIVLSSLAILVFAIPMSIIALIIYLTDRHSPFFVQERIGRFGRPFNMFKFRTMVPNADKMLDTVFDQNEMSGPVFKIKDDPRITKVGKILRKTSLDELPQFFNVIRGDMTLIGPRPPLRREVEQYNEYQKIRLIVTPGITCLWQVHPQRNSVPFDEWVRMDIDYILNRTIIMDIKIIFKTVIAMLSGEGE
ncbi:MAG: sugar transferase [Clostridiales bacterium]|nr:sugar transferase [Clostridiales bacterium]